MVRLGHYTDECYNFDDMMSTLQAATINDLVNVLTLILEYIYKFEEN